MIKSPVTITLSDSYQAVTLSSDAYGFSVCAVSSAGEIVPFYYATDSEGTDGALAPKTGLVWPHYEKSGATIMYAKAFSDSTLLVNACRWVKY